MRAFPPGRTACALVNRRYISENILEKQQYHDARHTEHAGDDRVEPAHFQRYPEIRAEEIHKEQHHKPSDGVQQQLERQLDGCFEQLDEKTEKNDGNDNDNDRGSGIPLAAQRIVFDKFERVITRNEDEKKKVSGFGLGLNYVMNVAREHGGYVSVESIEGKYSEFTVSLPLPAENEEANPED